MKIYAIEMPSGKLRTKIYQNLGHAKNAAHLRRGSKVVEFEAITTGVKYVPGDKPAHYPYDYVWLIEDETIIPEYPLQHWKELNFIELLHLRKMVKDANIKEDAEYLEKLTEYINQLAKEQQHENSST